MSCFDIIPFVTCFRDFLKIYLKLNINRDNKTDLTSYDVSVVIRRHEAEASLLYHLVCNALPVATQLLLRECNKISKYQTNGNGQNRVN